MNNNPQFLTDALLGLYLLADLLRGDPQFMSWQAGLHIGLVVTGDVHRLHLSRCGKVPSAADWGALLEAMPYNLAIEPTARSHEELYLLEATYRVQACACGYPRALISGFLHRCQRCEAAAIYVARLEVLL